jgi:hypothetical protein
MLEILEGDHFPRAIKGRYLKEKNISQVFGKKPKCCPNKGQYMYHPRTKMFDACIAPRTKQLLELALLLLLLCVSKLIYALLN